MMVRSGSKRSKIVCGIPCFGSLAWLSTLSAKRSPSMSARFLLAFVLGTSKFVQRSMWLNASSNSEARSPYLLWKDASGEWKLSRARASWASFQSVNLKFSLGQSGCAARSPYRESIDSNRIALPRSEVLCRETRA